MNTHAREFVMVERQRLRERAERTIEALMDILDQLDTDPDLEDCGDEEPTLGWEDGNPSRFAGGSSLGSLDCELDWEDCGPGDLDRFFRGWGPTSIGEVVP
ncbi:hypothetical protein [Ancylobacter pratisalsi]|uniref:hypothetical protein n=1 Tax=Ancylobacter pratisalsi TaxID=1745854 RepID=UPI001AED1C02|nr:hypothetical protein [Ancylobacter pratisalsi]